MDRFDRDARPARRGWPDGDPAWSGDQHLPTYPQSRRAPIDRGDDYGARGWPHERGYEETLVGHRPGQAPPPGRSADDFDYGGRPGPGPVWARRETERSDEDVREAVRENLFQDTWVDPRGIRVEVSDGVVTLEGEVRDFMEARYAWDDAWESDGVRGVINNLTVRSDED